MTYNKPNTKLDECIFVAEKIIPADICDSIIQDIETREWKPHTWYDAQNNIHNSEEKMEFDVQMTTPQLQKLLSPFVVESGRKYNQRYTYTHPSCYSRTGQIVFDFAPIRFNRYKPGQMMRQHQDHIHSLFDGKVRGIPALSFVFNFNDDYEGADLFFWEDTIVKLGKGDIIMFPSNWFFPHGVTEATKGKRYSGVTWAW